MDLRMETPFGDDKVGGDGRPGGARVDQAGHLIVPAEVLARAGIAHGQDVVVEATADGVRIVSDALRKVYVEATSHCNLDCQMCVRHGWKEPLGHMSHKLLHTKYTVRGV